MIKQIFIPKNKKIKKVAILATLIAIAVFLIWWFFIYVPPTKPLSPIEEQTVKADTLFQEGKTKEAKEAYDKVVDLAGTSDEKADAVEQKAMTCATYGDSQCAIDAVEEFKKYNQSEYKSVLLNATVLELIGKTKQAKEQYQKVLNILNSKNNLTEEEKLVKQTAEGYTK